MLSFSAAGFAIAGAIFAAGPIVIHLLNRRRYRVVHWAAMDFLRNAVKRNRRIMQLRDIILLAMRTAAILFFGLALARPFFSTSESEFDASQPLHAILVVDNSLSMGYDVLGETLLDEAKKRATGFIDELPKGSRISVLPVCGSDAAVSLDPYRTKDDAIDALERIKVVDRAAAVTAASSLAQRASELAPELAKRVVFFTDQQESNWRGVRTEEEIKQMPPMQVVEISPPGEAADQRENSWVASVRVQDGLADVETPTTVVAEVRHQGPSAREDVTVTFAVDGSDVAAKTIKLEPALGAQEVTFSYTFDTMQPEPGKPAFVPVSVSLPPDRLPGDDQGHLVVPVVASLPVLFIDQYSDMEEDPLKGKLGETWQLRRLLVPVTDRNDNTRQLVQIRHRKAADVTPEQLQDDLQDARLAVIAGVKELPPDAVRVLREYMLQGGQVFLGTGADFDPAAWTDLAWQDGRGILPLPLATDFLGSTPDEWTDKPEWFTLDVTPDSPLLHHYYFRLAGASTDQLVDVYSEPLFFKSVRVEESDELIDELIARRKDQLKEDIVFLQQAREKLAQWDEAASKGDLTEADQAARAAVELRVAQIQPDWVLFGSAVENDPLAHVDLEDEESLSAAVQQSIPQVLARYDNGDAFLVERKLGQGKVVMVMSGITSDWNTLAKTNAVIVLDRVVRSMIEATLPKRNFEASEEIDLPVPSEDPRTTLAVTRPGAEREEPLSLSFLGAQTRGVKIRGAMNRGLYTVRAYQNEDAFSRGSDDSPVTQLKLWELPVAVYGRPDESALAGLSRDDFDEFAASAGTIRWVGSGETISLAGSQIRGQNWWWYLVLFVLFILLAEIAVLAWPVAKQQWEKSPLAQPAAEAPARAG